jgi:hypothetical protein
MKTEIIKEVEKWFANSITEEFLKEHFQKEIDIDGEYFRAHFDEDDFKTDIISDYRNDIPCSEEEVFEDLKFELKEANFLKPSYSKFKITFANYTIHIAGTVEYEIKFDSNIDEWVLSEGDSFIDSLSQTKEIDVLFEIDCFGEIKIS